MSLTRRSFFKRAGLLTALVATGGIWKVLAREAPTLIPVRHITYSKGFIITCEMYPGLSKLYSEAYGEIPHLVKRHGQQRAGDYLPGGKQDIELALIRLFRNMVSQLD